MQSIKIAQSKYLLPTNWQEVKYKYLLKISPILLSAKPSESTAYALLSLYIKSYHLSSLKDWQLAQLLEIVSFVHKDPFRPLLPNFFRAKWSFLQFEIVPDKLTIIRVATAALYLPKINDPETFTEALQVVFCQIVTIKGQDFSEKSIPKINKAKIKPEIKILTLLWFAQWLDDFIEYYYPSHDLPSEEEKKPTQKQDYGLFPLIYHLAQQGTYGNYEQTCNIPIHTIFFNLMISK